MLNDYIKSLRDLTNYGTDILSMEIGAESFYVTNLVTDEVREVNTDTPAMIIDNRTLIPVRAISEVTGKYVEWDETERKVIITD